MSFVLILLGVSSTITNFIVIRIFFGILILAFVLILSLILIHNSIMTIISLYLQCTTAEDPSSQKGHSFIPEMTPEERRSSLDVCGPHATDFMNRCEFISLGCYCAPSYALQLMGLRKNSYPFDWTRSSLEGVLHCIDMKFEDFMTYSTYQMWTSMWFSEGRDGVEVSGTTTWRRH